MSIYPVEPAEPGTVWVGEIRWTQFAATLGAGFGAALGAGIGAKLENKNSTAIAGIIGAVAGAWLGVKYIRAG